MFSPDCLRVLSGIWYYLRCIAIYISSPSGAPLSTRATTKHEFWLVQLLVFIAVLDRELTTKQEPVDSWYLLVTHCSFQLCLRLFCNQTRRCIYRSVEVLYGECLYIEEAVYVINIHGKTVQWESRNTLQYYKIR